MDMFRPKFKSEEIKSLNSNPEKHGVVGLVVRGTKEQVTEETYKDRLFAEKREEKLAKLREKKNQGAQPVVDADSLKNDWHAKQKKNRKPTMFNSQFAASSGSSNKGKKVKHDGILNPAGTKVKKAKRNKAEVVAFKPSPIAKGFKGTTEGSVSLTNAELEAIQPVINRDKEIDSVMGRSRSVEVSKGKVAKRTGYREQVSTVTPTVTRRETAKPVETAPKVGILGRVTVEQLHEFAGKNVNGVFSFLTRVKAKDLKANNVIVHSFGRESVVLEAGFARDFKLKYEVKEGFEEKELVFRTKNPKTRAKFELGEPQWVVTTTTGRTRFQNPDEKVWIRNDLFLGAKTKLARLAQIQQVLAARPKLDCCLRIN